MGLLGSGFRMRPCTAEGGRRQWPRWCGSYCSPGGSSAVDLCGPNHKLVALIAGTASAFTGIDNFFEIDSETSSCSSSTEEAVADEYDCLPVRGAEASGLPPLSPAPGKVCDAYDLLDVVGEGCFGKVYKAVNKKSGEVVAVKELDPDSDRGVELEVLAWQRLKHPHIARLHAFYEAEEQCHVVMDYCAGGDLHAFLDQHVAAIQKYRTLYVGGLSAELARSCFWQMLSAVAYVHRQGIIHRDIKPENFLLATTSTRLPDLKLSDFGFAGVIRPGELLSEKLGTQFYAAPELLSGYYNQGADVWSLGVTGYVVCTWHLPFVGYDEREYDANAAAGRRRSGEDPWWAEHEPRMRAVIDSCLEPDPKSRALSAELILANAWLEESANASQSGCLVA